MINCVCLASLNLVVIRSSSNQMHTSSNLPSMHTKIVGTTVTTLYVYTLCQSRIVIARNLNCGTRCGWSVAIYFSTIIINLFYFNMVAKMKTQGFSPAISYCSMHNLTAIHIIQKRSTRKVVE